jgi:hypothetical protein
VTARRFGVIFAGIVAYIAYLAIIGPVTAQAATYGHACDPADTSCLAIAERLEQLDTDVTANGGKLDALGAKLDNLDSDLNAQAGQPVSGVVALGADDADRLDLTWIGEWFLAGLIIVSLIAPVFVRAFRFWS